MPYCPKCDMEFVEGMTVCTDCGGVLYESKEAALTELAAIKEKEEEALRLQYQKLLSQAEEMSSENQENPSEQNVLPARAYVNTKQRSEDMQSSATAFFLVGGALSVAAVLCWSGILTLPMAPVSRYIFQGVLTAMAAGSLFVAVSSKKSAALLKSRVNDEEQETAEIIDWFTAAYPADLLDQQILSEDSELSEEELSLKRFALIQDYLITGKDLPDPSYVDALCDMIYARLYE